MKQPARSRREFMRLLAAGTAAAMAAPVVAMAAESAKKAAATPPARDARPAPAAPRQRRARAGEPAIRPALPAEIEKQKQYLEGSLKRIRAYSLPPGSAPAFMFRPLASKRTKRAAR